MNHQEEIEKFFEDVGSIELDCRVYNKQKISIKDKKGYYKKIIEFKNPNDAWEALKELNKHWFETIKKEKKWE